MIQYLPGIRVNKRIFAREKHFSKSPQKETGSHFGKLYVCEGISEQLTMCIYLNIFPFIYNKYLPHFQINIFLFECFSSSGEKVFNCLQERPFEKEEIPL